MNDREIDLLCRVRGNGHPEGKPRFYISCHSSDAALYLEEIIADLLKRVNCAIWYKPDFSVPFQSQEEMQLTLGQMQLFVFPVTTRLLTTPNPAMDQDYAFAIENHIPILPLMEEDGIDDLYEQRFGSLQYLAPKRQDSTAIGFDQKMDRFFEHIIVDDDLVDTIRAAFDAYIFLSYRKKDRQQALQLMRLIHENEKCENLAIWYDEYLGPETGSFHEAIQAALTKSDIFALLVTPNLVNEPNYVMQIEYPAAKKADKKIIPMEVQPTDRSLLERLFSELPSCIDGQSQRDITVTLMDALQSIVFSERHSDPEHDLFIGLAYLVGIDVEIDREKALRLIQRAADQGVPEAYEQLSAMYQQGNGVPRDEEKALTWQEKLIDMLKEKGDISGTCKAMMTYAHSCFDMMYYADATHTSLDMIKLAEGMSDEVEKNRLKAEGYDLLSDCSSQYGYYDDANELNVKAAQCRYGKDLANAQWTSETFPYLYDFFIRLANNCLSQQKYDEAAENYKLAESVLSFLQKGGVPSERLQAAYAYLSLMQGQISSARGQYDQAGTNMQRSLEFYTQLSLEYPDVSINRSKLNCICALADNEQNNHQYKRANEYYSEAMCLAEQLFEETGSIQYVKDIASICQKLTSIGITTGHLAEAREAAIRFRKDSKQIYERSESKVSAESYATSYIETAQIDMAEGNRASAKADLTKAEEILLNWTKDIAIPAETRKLLATVYYLFGDASLTKEPSQSGKRAYRKALDILTEKQTDESDPDFPVLAPAKALVLERMGRLTYSEGNMSEAQSLFEQALSICQRLCSLSPDPDNTNNQWTILQSLGDIAVVTGRYDQARKYYHDALMIVESFAKKTDNFSEKRALAIMYERKGMVADVAMNPSEAFEAYQQMFLLADEIAQHVEGILAITDLCRAYRRIGESLQKAGDLQKAKEIFEEMHNTASAAIQRYGKTDELNDMLSLSDTSLGSVLKDMEEWDAAKNCLTRGIQLRQELEQNNHSTDNRYPLFTAYNDLFQVLSMIGEKATAKAISSKMLALARQMFTASSALPMKLSLIQGLITVASVTSDQGDDAKALALFQESIDLSENLLANYGSAAQMIYILLINASYACANIKTNLNETDASIPFYEKATKYANHIQLEQLDQDCQLLIAWTYIDYAYCLVEMQRNAQAVEMANRAFSVADPLFRHDSSQTDAALIAIKATVIICSGFYSRDNIQEGNRWLDTAMTIGRTVRPLLEAPEDMEELRFLMELVSSRRKGNQP